MLAEKFFLYLETLLKSQNYPDGGQRVVSTSPHIPVSLPRNILSRCHPEPIDRLQEGWQPSRTGPFGPMR